MLRGHATAKIDAKGRVKIPSDFLDEFVSLCGEHKGIYVTSLDGSSVRVTSPADRERPSAQWSGRC